MKRILAVFCMLIISGGSLSFAQGPTEKDAGAYIKMSDGHIVYEGHNYENVHTGEYVRWENEIMGTNKSYSFRIKNSADINNIMAYSQRAKVIGKMNVVHSNGSLGNATGHRYNVSIIGKRTRTLNFAIARDERGSVSDLKKNGNYTLRVTNVSNLPRNTYLEGRITISYK